MMMNKIKQKYLFALLIMLLMLGGCKSKDRTAAENSPDFETFTWEEDMELRYATQFHVEKYGAYRLITIVDTGRYLVVPEGEKVPGYLPEDVAVLQQPLDRVYLVSTSAMDFVRQIGSILKIRLSGTKENGWHIGEAAEAMKNGDMLYAGKYSAPDYELILKEGCDLAVENTMIYHNPEVKEKLEELGIPVLVERSSYEEHPLGRLEWIKLYGVLFHKENDAEAFYEEQLKNVEAIINNKDTGCSAAFFYVTANGSVNVRKPKDYIAQMIELAGGHYVLDQSVLADDNALSTMNMQMEDFYAAAKDADVLIYNSTIEGELESVESLTRMNPLFLDFKAVRDGNVYCTSDDFFQKTTGECELIEDLSRVFSGSSTGDFTCLRKLR